MNRKNLLSILILTFIILFNSSCDPKNGVLSNPKESLSKGKAEFMVDESFKPIFDQLQYTFEGQKPDAHLTMNYVPENEAINSFFNKEIKTIVVSRDLTKEEKKQLVKRRIHLFSDQIASDGVALLVNKENADSALTIEEISKIFTGENKNWKTSGKEISMIFDHENSANFNYLRNLANNKAPGKNVYSFKTTLEVIDFVKKNKNAIGVIGMSWISDEDDPKSSEYLSGLSMVAVSKSKNGTYYQPYQNDIFTKNYPLTRQIWILNRAGNGELNSGFVNFCLLEKGQLIIHKASLVPHYTPPRRLKISTH